MKTVISPKLPKKRGPVPSVPPMVDTHVYLPENLLEWAKHQPGGFARLVRALLLTEWRRQMLQNQPLPPDAALGTRTAEDSL